MKSKILLAVLLTGVSLSAWPGTPDLVDDTFTGAVCSDGLFYTQGCPSTGDPEEITEPGIYVDCSNGNNSNNGTSHAQRVATLQQAHTLASNGDNIYWFGGSVCEDQTLTISKSGITLGTYYLDSGNSNLPTLWPNGTGSGRGIKSNINGTYETVCRANRDCAMGSGSGAVPIWNPGDGLGGGLINVNTSADNTTLQDFTITDSAGIGIATGAQDSLTIRRIEAHVGLAQAYRGGNDNTNTLIQDFTATNWVECDRFESSSSYPCNTSGAGQGGGHVPQISCGRRATGFVGDDIFSGETYGESLSCSRSPENGYIVGLVSWDSRTAAILLSESRNITVEAVLSLNASDAPATYGVGSSIRSTDESRDPFSNAPGEIWNEDSYLRNFLAFRDGGRCVFPGITSNARNAGRLVYQKMYSWACYDQQDEGTPAVHDQQGSFTELEVVNSMFYSPDNSNQCTDNSPSDTDIWLDNTWHTSGRDADCGDAGDEFGEPDLTVDVDTFSITSSEILAERDTPQNLWAHFELQPGSIGCGTATPQVAATIDASLIPRWAEATSYWTKVGATINQTDWEKRNFYDALGRPRDATNPDKGPLEGDCN